MALDSILNSRADEQRWVEQMSDILKKEVNNDLVNIPACIFQVPKTVSAVKPEAYAPQLIALGPYHHFRPDLYVMERHKLAAVKRAQTQFQDNLKFERIVDKLMELELNIRACYHKYLDLDGVTLAWMMAIDVSFLLDFLATFVDNKGIHTLSSSSSTSADPSPFIFDSTGRRLAQDAILRDVMMLENQIPIFLLREMLAIRCSFFFDKVDEVFPAILVGFCKAISPLKLEDYPLHKVTKHVHLLDLLYFMILPRNEPGNSDVQSRIRIDERPGEVFLNLWAVASTQVGIISKIKEPVESIVGVISKLPGISNLVAKLSSGETTQNNDSSESKGPLVEDIMVPSASSLFSAGVKFSHTTAAGSIKTISFDEKTIMLHLPVINLDVNSEVVMRNLVAYEASTMSESLLFTRYTQFMNLIIDTADDVKLLRERGIIVNHLKSDEEVAELFNGMSKSIGLTDVSDLDETIEKLNKFYNGNWEVRGYKLMKKYVFASWKMLTLVATILLLLLMGLQAFCSVYNCPRSINNQH